MRSKDITSSSITEYQSIDGKPLSTWYHRTYPNQITTKDLIIKKYIIPLTAKSLAKTSENIEPSNQVKHQSPPENICILWKFPKAIAKKNQSSHQE